MKKQPAWDQYETALLIKAYIDITKNPHSKKKVVHELSCTLRDHAINRGLRIDQIYRNENGINLRLSEIHYLFATENKGITRTSRLFKNMVDLYIEDREEFNSILLEAKRKYGFIQSEVSDLEAKETENREHIPYVEGQSDFNKTNTLEKQLTLIEDEKERDRDSLREDRERFFRWLINEKGIRKESAAQIVKDIENEEYYAEGVLSHDCKLYSASIHEIVRTIELLSGDDGFVSYNYEHYNKLFNSLRLFYEYSIDGVDDNEVFNIPNNIIIYKRSGKRFIYPSKNLRGWTVYYHPNKSDCTTTLDNGSSNEEQEKNVKIIDVISSEHSDFLSYCAGAGKVYISDITNVDLVAFRTSSGQSREYIKTIRTKLDNSMIASGNETDIAKAERVYSGLVSYGDIQGEKTAFEVNANNERLIKGESIVYQEETEENFEHQIIYDNEEDTPVPNVSQDNIQIDTANSPTELNNANDAFAAESAPEGNKKTSEANTDYIAYENYYTLAQVFDVDPTIFEKIEVIALNLSVRSTNCLKRANINTVAELLTKTEDDLQAIKNMGNKSLTETITKARNFVSEFGTIQSGSFLATPLSSKKWGQIDLNSALESSINSLLTGEYYTTEGFNENQRLYFEELKETVDTIGEEICFEAYHNPEYASAVCNALCAFAAPYIHYHNIMNEIVQRVSCLSEHTRQLKVIPFIQAYSVKAGKKLSFLLSECHDDTTIECVPNLCKRLSRDENRIALLTDTNRFLKWLEFDVPSLTTSIEENLQSVLSGKNDRIKEVFALRLEGVTLEEIGSRYGVTRERIRQIEKKYHNVFWGVYKRQKYDLIMLAYALRNGDNVLFYDELREVIGEEFATILWACIKYTPKHDHYYYSKALDAIWINVGSTKNMNEESLLASINNLVITLPGVMHISEKEELLNDLAKKNALPMEVLLNVFNSIYQQTGQFFHSSRITVIFMCEYVLKNRFRAGYKIADDFEAERFRQCMVELFGERANSITNRAIDADIIELGVLCDRGKYIHPDYLVVDQHVIDSVNDYIEESPRLLFPYGEIFDALKDEFEGTQITNKYILQGALKKYGCRFSKGRHFVRKTNSVTFVDELESFISDRGVVHKSEIFAEFTSLGEAGLAQVVSRSSNVFNIDNGYYIHADQFEIQPDDYEKLRDYLQEACKEIPVNIRAVYDAVAGRFPEFMYRNDFEDRNKLFAALNYMFRGEFSFSRPYIAKLGVSDITNRGVILQHIEDYDSIEIEELIDICDDNSIHYVAPAYLCQSMAPDFFRVNRTTLMRREIAGITDEVIEKANDLVSDLVEANGYIVGGKINDFLWYPQIDVEWNEFLLESLLVYCKKTNVVFMFGDPLRQPNAIYVSEKYKKDTFDSFLIKILTDKVSKGTFSTKTEMRDWLREEGMIKDKLPKFLVKEKYFYVNETGVHCVER